MPRRCNSLFKTIWVICSREMLNSHSTHNANNFYDYTAYIVHRYGMKTIFYKLPWEYYVKLKWGSVEEMVPQSGHQCGRWWHWECTLCQTNGHPWTTADQGLHWARAWWSQTYQYGPQHPKPSLGEGTVGSSWSLEVAPAPLRQVHLSRRAPLTLNPVTNFRALRPRLPTSIWRIPR